MPETVLCEGNPRVSVDGLAGRALIVISDGDAVRFWTATEDLEAALAGEPFQVSADEGFLKIEVVAGIVHLAYEFAGAGVKECQIPAPQLEQAIAIVRAEKLRDVANPGVIVEDVP